MLSLNEADPLLRQVDHARVSIMHAFQGRVVDNPLAVMNANRPRLVSQKGFRVGIGRPRSGPT